MLPPLCNCMSEGLLARDQSIHWKAQALSVRKAGDKAVAVDACHGLPNIGEASHFTSFAACVNVTGVERAAMPVALTTTQVPLLSLRHLASPRSSETSAMTWRNHDCNESGAMRKGA